LLKDGFGKVYEDPVIELMNLKQHSILTIYHEELDATINQFGFTTRL